MTSTCGFLSRRCTAWCPGWWRPTRDWALRSRSTACSLGSSGSRPAPCIPRSPDPHILRRPLNYSTQNCSAASDSTNTEELGKCTRRRLKDESRSACPHWTVCVLSALLKGRGDAVLDGADPRLLLPFWVRLQQTTPIQTHTHTPFSLAHKKSSLASSTKKKST